MAPFWAGAAVLDVCAIAVSARASMQTTTCSFDLISISSEFLAGRKHGFREFAPMQRCLTAAKLRLVGTL